MTAIEVPNTPAQRRGFTAPTLAVDLDETVAWTVGHWMTRLRNEFPIEGSPSVEQLIHEHRFAQNVPHWKTNTEALKRMQQFRCCPELHRELPIIPGSVEALRRLENLFSFEYLTMRNEIVLEATKDWLLLHKFPAGDVTVCPSETPLAEKTSWKARVLELRYPNLVGIIEDHPDVIQSLPGNYKGTVFFYSHTESPRSDIRVIPCPTWEHVEQNIRRELPRLLGIDRSAE
jgi:5'(3')-deoxyribonucleotidase